MRADCHMHTYFSGDSEAKPEDMVLAAIDKGLEAICLRIMKILIIFVMILNLCLIRKPILKSLEH